MRATVRARLTAWYAAVALAGGALLVAGSFVLAGRSVDRYPRELAALVARHPRAAQLPTRSELAGLSTDRSTLGRAEEEARLRIRRSLLLQLSALLAAFALVAVATGLVVSRRVLAPVQRLTGTARRIGAGSLHERLRLAGPDDELKELGDTFDEMLDRVEQALERERAFVANASHELRTPLAIVAAEIDAARSAAGALDPAVARSFDVIAAATSRSEQLVRSLLALARAGRGPGEQAAVELAPLIVEALDERSAAVAAQQLAVDASLDDCRVAGDDTLLRQLVQNLVDNAVRHNRRGGAIRVVTGRNGSGCTLQVESDGPPLEHVERLVEPFTRGAAGAEGGVGLGLAIVDAVARAHDGSLALEARREGGLRVVVRLPAAAS